MKPICALLQDEKRAEARGSTKEWEGGRWFSLFSNWKLSSQCNCLRTEVSPGRGENILFL